MTADRAPLLGETVRVWDGPSMRVRAQGKLVAIIPEPVLVIEAADGTRFYESPTLPLEVCVTEWRRV